MNPQEPRGQPPREPGTSTGAAAQHIAEVCCPREQEFQALFENAPDIIARFDRELRHLYVNTVVERATGLPPHAFIGKTNRELGMEAKFVELWESALRRVLETREMEEIAFSFLSPDGERFFQSRIVPELAPDGSVQTVLGITRDVTEQQRAADALRQSEERHHLVMRATNDVIRDWDLVEDHFYWSETVRTVFGYRAEEVRESYDWWAERVHAEDRERVCSGLLSVVRGREELWTDKYRFRRGDGSYAIVLDRGYVARDAAGAAVRMIGSMMDISEREVAEQVRQAAEEQLRQSEQRFRALVEKAEDLITVLDADGTIRYESPAAKRVAGWSPEERIGRNAFEFVHPDDVERVQQAFGALLRDPGGTTQLEVRFQHVAGHYVALEVSGTNLLHDPAVRGVVVNSRDLTERRRAEAALRESEARLQLFLQQTPAVLWSTDAQLCFTMGRGAGLNALGYSDNSTVDISLFELFGTTDAEHPAIAAHRRALAGESVSYEMEWLGATFASRVQPFRDAEGVVRGVIGLAVDISERKAAEQALRQAEERAQQMAARMKALATAASGVIGAPSYDALQEVVRGACQQVVPFDAFTFGLHDEAAGTLSFLETYDADLILRQRVELPLADTPSQGVVRERRSLLTHSSADPRAAGAMRVGTGRRSESVIRTPILAQERVLGVLSAQSYTPHLYSEQEVEVLEALAALTATAILNIQHREETARAEEALRESEERFRQIAETIREVFWLMDPTKVQVIYVSPGYETIWGRTQEELYRNPRSWIDAVHPEDRDRIAARLPEMVEGTYDVEYRIIRPDGEVRWIRDHAFPVHDASGAVYRVTGLAADITKRKQAEEELIRSNAELESFAYVASHDLQEPLRKILSFGDRLKSQYAESLGEQGRDYLERMQKAGARMHTLITDLLALSRIRTRGQAFAPVDLAEVVREVASDLEARVLESGGHIEIGDLPVLSADALQMRQLFQNLIGNALKFRRRDVAPVIRVYSTPIEPEKSLSGRMPRRPQTYRIFVEDNGIGFEEQYAERIFLPFQRLHGRSEYEGTGMGLAICQKITERHRGSLTAHSMPGEGATFLVVLPSLPAETTVRTVTVATTSIAGAEIP